MFFWQEEVPPPPKGLLTQLLEKQFFLGGLLLSVIILIVGAVWIKYFEALGAQIFNIGKDIKPVANTDGLEGLRSELDVKRIEKEKLKNPEVVTDMVVTYRTIMEMHAYIMENHAKIKAVLGEAIP